MRNVSKVAVLVAASLVASPALACGFDGMFGFNHYSEVAPDQAAADAMREAAIAQARDNFMARHGMEQVADAGSTDPGVATSASVVVANTTPSGGAPQ